MKAAVLAYKSLVSARMCLVFAVTTTPESFDLNGFLFTLDSFVIQSSLPPSLPLSLSLSISLPLFPSPPLSLPPPLSPPYIGRPPV